MSTRQAERRIQLKLLPLALAAIVLGTAIPIELGAVTLPSTTLRPADFLLNIALYVPLGFALWASPRGSGLIWRWWSGPHHGALRPWSALAAGALLSAIIEVLQIWFVNRQPSVLDIAANTFGTAVGIALAGIRVRRRVSGVTEPIILVGWLIAAGAAAAALVVAILLVYRAYPNDLSNWDPRHELLIGNELTGERPWKGVISRLAVVPGAMPLNEIRELTPGKDEATVGQLGRWLVDSPVKLDGKAVRITDRLDEDFVSTIAKRNAFTVIVQAATADIAQDGPARLVSFSQDLYHRNFDIGQQGQRIRFRVRTPIAGLNGQDIYAETADVLEEHRVATLVATYDGDIARIYIDGLLEGRTNLAAATCLAYSVCDEDLPLAAGVLGASLVVCGLALIGNRRRGRWLAVLGSTTITAALVYVGRAGSTVPQFHHRFTLVALGAAAVVALSVRPNRSNGAD